MGETGIIKLPVRFAVLMISTSWLMGCALSDGVVLPIDSQPQGVTDVPSTVAQEASPAQPQERLSADQIYRVLAAESLAAKGQIAPAASVYLDLAERYDDAAMAQRAYDLATQSGSRSLLVSASKINTELNPNFIESWQVQVVLQLRAGDVPAALSAWESFYQHSLDKGVSEKEIFLSTATLAQEDMDAQTLLSFSEQLAIKHPSAYAEFAHVMLMAASGSVAAAFDRVMIANAHYPDQTELAQLTASLAVKLADGRGVDWLSAYWHKHPEDLVVGEQLGRVYVASGQLPAAQSQFRSVLQQSSSVASVQMSLALVELELKQYEDAEHLLQPLTHDKRYADMARYYLGQALYGQEKTADAMQVWALVLRGEYRVDALIWRAQVLSKQNQLAEAQALLGGFTAVDDGEQERLLRARVRLYLLQKQPADAIKLLDEAIAANPDEGTLWQERANIKLELGDGAGFEKDIRQSIVLSPNDADTLNTLGYYLADKKRSLSEARQLIEKANKLLPNKFYIVDSLGWLDYQEGKLADAESLLATAYTLKNDAEILRHWLTVLLAQNNKLRAQELVQREAKQFADDVPLTNFLRQMSLVP